MRSTYSRAVDRSLCRRRAIQVHDLTAIAPRMPHERGGDSRRRARAAAAALVERVPRARGGGESFAVGLEGGMAPASVGEPTVLERSQTWAAVYRWAHGGAMARAAALVGASDSVVRSGGSPARNSATLIDGLASDPSVRRHARRLGRA